MKDTVKALWLEALRSGKYKQGTGCLRYEDDFCCLGVLCDISGQGEWDEREYLDQLQLLPAAVVDWAGLGGSRPEIPFSALTEEELELIGWLPSRDECTVALSGLNDRGMEFDRIADLIEAHV
jgi:hypothetical protein